MSDDAPAPGDPRVSLALGRTAMATYRTALAIDRTMLAWIRTSLSMASFGFGMVAFFRTLEERSPGPETRRMHAGAVRMGTALLLLGIASVALAGFAQWSTLRKLRRGEEPTLAPWPPSLTVAIFAAIIGLIGLWTVFAW